MEDPVRYVSTRPDPSAEPGAGSPQTLRRTVRDLRLEVERRAWARRTPWGPGDTLLTPVPHPPDAASREAASDPIAGLLAQLRAAIERYVYELRAEGAPPERMLVRVKAFVRETMSTDGWTDPEATHELTQIAVRWSIDAYYSQ